jgi:hypothetical protein
MGMTSPKAAYYYNASGGTGSIRQGCGSGAMFHDIQSLLSGLVDEVFHRTSHPASMEELRQCFGSPFSITCSPQGDSGITYRFQQPKELFLVEKEDICRSPCIQFHAHSSEAVAVGQHFRQCREALLTLGVSIALEIDDQEKWSDDDIVACWHAAAGGDAIDVLLADDDVLWSRLPFHERHQRLLRNIRLHCS